MTTSPGYGETFLIVNFDSQDERSRNEVRSRVLSHAAAWAHIKRRERKRLQTKAKTSSEDHSSQKPASCGDKVKAYLDAPVLLTTLSPGLALPDLPQSRSDVEFYIAEIAPQFHMTHKIFNVYDVYHEYLRRPIAPIAFMTWQCNMSSYRSRLLPTANLRDQYYQKYGEVLSVYKRKLFSMDLESVVNEEILETMLMLTNVSFISEGPQVGEMHFSKLLDVLAAHRTELWWQDSTFLRCLLRQWCSTWNIVRRQLKDPIYIEEFDQGLSQQFAGAFGTPDTYDGLAEGFRNLADAQRVSTPTIRMLVRLTAILRPQQQSIALLHSEAFCDFEDACPCLGNKQMTFEKLLCMTVMIYTNLVSSPNGRGCEWILYFRVRRDLLTETVAVYLEPHPAEKPCFLWIVAVLALAWFEGLEIPTAKSIDLMRSLRRRFVELDYFHVVSVLRSFVWDEKLTVKFRRLWCMEEETR